MHFKGFRLLSEPQIWKRICRWVHYVELCCNLEHDHSINHVIDLWRCRFHCLLISLAQYKRLSEELMLISFDIHANETKFLRGLEQNSMLQIEVGIPKTCLGGTNCNEELV